MNVLAFTLMIPLWLSSISAMNALQKRCPCVLREVFHLISRLHGDDVFMKVT